MELSLRLQAVADMVSPGTAVADIGTDHGYVPIYLVSEHKNPGAIAMDVNPGPLERAKAHIEDCGLERYIDTRLSDGLNRLYPGEVQSVIMAGMGGGLTIRIMEHGANVILEETEMILQPQSEIREVRKYLNEHGFRIFEENMVLEEGKFYPMMRVMRGEKEAYQELEYRYGKYLLQMHHPVLKQYLERQKKINRQVYENLEGRQGEHISCRRNGLEFEFLQISEALATYENM